jgi:hypothetical protein
MEQVATVVRPLGPDVMVSYSSKDVPLEKESRDGVGIAAWGSGELASLLFPLRGCFPLLPRGLRPGLYSSAASLLKTRKVFLWDSLRSPKAEAVQTPYVPRAF